MFVAGGVVKCALGVGLSLLTLILPAPLAMEKTAWAYDLFIESDHVTNLCYP